MIELVNPQNNEEVNAFLLQNGESAQFLINNLREHGPKLNEHPNSGNFKAIKNEEGRIHGVFCLTRRGNLIIQSEIISPEIILDACTQEHVKIKGFIGDWNSVEPVYLLFKERNITYKPSYESKEILYSYILTSSDLKLKHDSRVRFLEVDDFAQWLEFSNAYMSELSLPDNLSAEQKRKDFDSQVSHKIWWGLFDGKKLLSRAALNSKGDTTGQVGGVFTPKEHRQKGLAKAVMFHMLKDCRDLHRHTKSILFTGEADMPAQKLYESMGYSRIGSFALILGS